MLSKAQFPQTILHCKVHYTSRDALGKFSDKMLTDSCNLKYNNWKTGKRKFHIYSVARRICCLIGTVSHVRAGVQPRPQPNPRWGTLACSHTAEHSPSRPF